MKFLYLLFFVSFLILGFVLSILNSAPIKINYYYGWLEMPLSFALLITLVFGILLGISTKLFSNYKLRRQYKKLSKQASKTQQEVSNLRTYPVKPLLND